MLNGKKNHANQNSSGGGDNQIIQTLCMCRATNEINMLKCFLTSSHLSFIYTAFSILVDFFFGWCGAYPQFSCNNFFLLYDNTPPSGRVTIE